MNEENYGLPETNQLASQKWWVFCNAGISFAFQGVYILGGFSCQFQGGYGI